MEDFARLVITVGIMVLSQTVGAKGGRNSASLQTCNIPAIYNFGDSNSDTGGISAAFYPMPTPYGETFFKRSSGRASDGRLIIDFIAEHLGLPYLSAYLDSIKTNFSNGANFATGGATISRINESWFENTVSPFSLDIQVVQFDQFKEKSTYFYNQASDRLDRSDLPRPEDFSKALYVFDIGQNDIAYGFRKQGVESTRTILPNIVNQFAFLVQQLYAKGARVFWVHNSGPIGCLAVTHAKVHDPAPGYLDENGCVADKNAICKEFNKQLNESLAKLRTQLPEASITYVDIYAAKYELITSAKIQGFEDGFRICCGYHDLKDTIWCGSKGKLSNGTEITAGSCEDPSKVISWDGVHNTEGANRWIASRIVNGSFSDPPISITQACHKSS